jgi:spore germination protein KB
MDARQNERPAGDTSGGSDMKKSISAKQLMYSTALFIVASNLLTKTMYVYTKNQTWIAVIIATFASVAIISVYGKLIKNHPGISLFKINEAVFGTAGGKIMSAVYLFFFLTLTAFNTRDVGNFVHGIVLPTTPLNLIYIAFLIICAYAVKKGADKMTRYGALIFYIYLVLLLSLTCLLTPKMQFQNFLPVFTVPLKNILLSANLLTMLPYAEIFVFLMMAQHVDKPEAVGKALKRGLLIGAVIILLLVARDIAVLGGYVLYTSSPTFNTIRLIDVGDILTRLEIINAVLLITLLFFKVSVLLYAVVTGIGQLFNIKNDKIFTLIVGALTIICANFFFVSSSEHKVWFSVAATYSAFFLLILPLLTLIVSEIKKKPILKDQADMRPQQ